MLIELHALQNHAPSNLNRDDTGSPKEAFFGGHRRARISSQCLKRSIRKSPLFKAELGDELAFRTKRLAERVEHVLKEKLGCDEEKARRIARRASVLGSGGKQDKEAEEAAKAQIKPEDSPSDKPKRRGKQTPGSQAGEDARSETKQLIFLGPDEILAVAQALIDLEKDHGAAFDTLKAADIEKAVAQKVNPKGGPRGAIPVEIALFGRMTTSDAFEDVTAAVQVAHALSTHKLDHEFDYYTAVDDLKDARAGDDAGAGMVGDVEFNSSCFYKYFSLDWEALVAKVQDAEIAKKALGALVQAAVLTTPTGKQNSFAAHNPPDFLLVECKTNKIPISYANAFVKPAAPHGALDLVDDSIAKLAGYVKTIKETYAIEAQRFWLATREGTSTCEGTKVNTLKDLIARVIAAVCPDGQKGVQP
jgi:CRISPR system Cascade subunit CasC